MPLQFNYANYTCNTSSTNLGRKFNFLQMYGEVLNAFTGKLHFIFSLCTYSQCVQPVIQTGTTSNEQEKVGYWTLAELPPDPSLGSSELASFH